MEARLAAVEGPWEHPLKACFPKIYRGNNYIAYYNFY